MIKKIVNIDSRFRNKDIFLHPNNFTLDISLKNIIYIKLYSISISNNYEFFNNERFNNFFYIKCIFNGPPIGPNVFTLPLNNTKIVIFNNSFNIINIINNINNELNKLKYNEYDDNKNIVKGIYFYLNNITNKINIKNLSNHYDCEIIFNNNNIQPSLGIILGFINNNYLLNYNNNLEAELLYINYDKYIFIKINNYSNIYINNKLNQSVFAKLYYNNLTNNYTDIFSDNNIYNIINESNTIDKLDITIYDSFYNNLYLYDNFSFTLEFGINITNKNSENINKKKKKKKKYLDLIIKKN